MSLNDLPDEVLCQIFDYADLDVYEMKLASLVCWRWANLIFSGRRMDQVLLLMYNSDFILDTKRKYRNVCQLEDKTEDGNLVRLLHLNKSELLVRMLHLDCFLTPEQLRLVLLEAPELQHLSIEVIKNSNCGTNGPFPVLPKLTSLSFTQSTDEHFDFFRQSMPNLQSLDMNCASEFDLKVWKHLSGQLKLAHVRALQNEYIDLFLELTFPFLEDLSVNKDNRLMLAAGVMTSHDFFQKHHLLRKLSIGIPLECVESLTSHCRELTYLHLNLNGAQRGFLEPLAQLTKLKHLSLSGEVDRNMFRGTLMSLERVELDMLDVELLVENLFEVAPQLYSLKLKHGNHDLRQLQFICENFLNLQHLEVNLEKVTATADSSVRFDGLANLQELTLRRIANINYIRHKTLPCLTISYSHKITDDNLYEIPGKLPLLKSLIIEHCALVSLAGVERLHKLMPSCRIDYDDERFYPFSNPMSDELSDCRRVDDAVTETDDSGCSYDENVHVTDTWTTYSFKLSDLDIETGTVARFLPIPDYFLEQNS